MKKFLPIIFCSLIFTTLCYSGPVNVKNETYAAIRVADDQAKVGPLYLSDDAYIALLTAASNVNQIKDALLKKAISDKMKSDKQKSQHEKIKEKK
jgi:hypothetical protein